MNKLGTMLPDVVRSMFHHHVTEDYPTVHSETPPRLRGSLEWDPQACSGCGLCVMDCPASALELVVLDRKAKRYVMTYHEDRCTFCGQCVMSCRQKSLAMPNDRWELASLDPTSFIFHFGDVQDVEHVLANKPENNAQEID
jgi:formate hydrogenlyase subunit 6